jgi:2-polyprenyl-3-methyl-5-hydroxy-6-metoxy-1,4-benzoquinol methylase
MKRTIICLAVNRSGTTAVHNMFVNHPDVSICHPDQKTDLWEPNYWNYAADALGSDATPAAFERFKERMVISAPPLRIESPLTEEKTFGYWNAILEMYGPVVFDKSPQYLGSQKGLELLYKYIQCGADVRIFGLIRDPRDAISSQYELWKDVYKPGTPQYRDSHWVENYRRFQWFQGLLGKENCPIIRYEDFSADPKRWGSFIFQYCGVADIPQVYAHVRPVHVGRYYETEENALLEWEFSRPLIDVAAQYGYVLTKASRTQRATRRLRRNAHHAFQFVRHGAMGKIKSFIKKIVYGASDHFTAQKLEAVIFEIVKRRVNKLRPATALEFLFRLDAAVYTLQGQTAVEYGDGVHTKHRHMKYHDFFVNRITNEDHVMDIGCGIGVVAYDVAQVAAQVVGMDFNETSIRFACERYHRDNLEFRVGDALKTLPDETFSVVILSNVLEHLPGRPQFLRRVQETLKPKRILIRVPIFERDWRVPLKKELGVEWRLDPTHVTEYTLESFTEEMREANLHIAHLEVRWGEIWAEVSQNS